MEISSLGARTDLAVLRAEGAEVEDAGEVVVVRSPDNPSYWWGNCLIVAAGAQDMAPWIARFAQEFPGAAHLALSLDGTDGAVPAHPRGLSPHALSVLTAERLDAAPGVDAELRELDGDGDWAQAAWLQEVQHGFEAEFTRRRVVAWRRVAASGAGAWVGAFADGMLRASLGLVAAGDGDARFQAVDTHPAWRGRGLASALLAFAAGRVAHRRLVIVAEPGEPAERLYLARGFTRKERQLQLRRTPADATA